MSWSAEQYSLFEAERNRPAIDLLARVSTAPVRWAVDIGCGPGNSTEILRWRYPNAELQGMDSSPEMISAARKRLPDVQFKIADIANWEDEGPFDLILANAVLQWVPGHDDLMPRLISKLAPGGSLAVQLPDNFDAPTHTLIRKVAEEGPWAERVSDSSSRWDDRHDAEYYYRLLSGLAVAVDCWRTTYYQRLAGGSPAVVEWVKGTALRPFLLRLDQVEQAAFLDRYEAEIAAAYPASPDGTVLLPFSRIFMVART